MHCFKQILSRLKQDLDLIARVRIPDDHCIISHHQVMRKAIVGLHISSDVRLYRLCLGAGKHNKVFHLAGDQLLPLGLTFDLGDLQDTIGIGIVKIYLGILCHKIAGDDHSDQGNTKHPVVHKNKIECYKDRDHAHKHIVDLGNCRCFSMDRFFYIYILVDHFLSLRKIIVS